MLIYLVESLIFSLFGLAWVTLEGLLYSVSPIDSVVFYTQTVYTLFLCVMMLLFPNKKYVTLMLCVHLSLFLFYIHCIDQFFFYNSTVSDITQRTCTNSPHSQSYRTLLQGNIPVELSAVYSSISLALLFIQAILAIASQAGSLLQSTLWCDTTLCLMCSLHLYASWMDNFVLFFSVILLVAFCGFVLFLVLGLGSRIVHIALVGIISVDMCLFLFQHAHTYYLYTAYTLLLLINIGIFYAGSKPTVVLSHTRKIQQTLFSNKKSK